MFATIYRDSTDLGASGTGGMTEHYGDGSRLISTSSMSILDSPNTTQAVTYTVYGYVHSGGGSGGSFYLGLYDNQKFMHAMEVSA